MLAGLVRCTLTSMDHAARRARLEVDIAPAPEAAALHDLVAKAEHGCFVSNSLTARPRHRWIVNGQEVL